jgi:endonuclease/exonuclease/phosphatase family metal-dependent hydrolase
MARSRAWLATVGLGGLIAACGNGDDDVSRATPAPVVASAEPTATEPSTTEAAVLSEPTPAPSVSVAPTAPPPSSLALVTFNAGLARGFVDLAAERAPLVADAVAALDADVVALQEVWDPEDVQAVATAVQDRFPGQCFLEPAPETAGAPACPPPESDALESCARTACSGVAPEQLAGCVLDSCGAEYAALSGGCQTCLAANIGGSLDAVVASCASATEMYAYGGSFGIGLLSRQPIETWDETVLESSLNRRAVIHAVIDVDGRSLHVFATHLSPIFDDIPFPGEGSWEAEQRAQIERLLALIEARVPAGEPVVVLGDLNTGPALPGVAAEAADNFELLRAAGLVAPYVDSPPQPACTFCAENPLVGGTDDDDSVLIDHVLVSGLEATAVARILDQPIAVGTTESRLSDHYGVEVTVSFG